MGSHLLALLPLPLERRGPPEAFEIAGSVDLSVAERADEVDGRHARAVGALAVHLDLHRARLRHLAGEEHGGDGIAARPSPREFAVAEDALRTIAARGIVAARPIAD